MRNKNRWAALAAVALAASACAAGTTATGSPRPAISPSRTSTTTHPLATTTYPNWPTYHFNSTRTGYYSSMPAVGTSHPLAWSVGLDGAAYAEPLVINGLAIIATENDSVYAFHTSNGTLAWKDHVGTPIPRSSLPCGNIDPLGITGTPVWDSATNRVFFVAEVRTSTGTIAHYMYAANAATGHIDWSRRMDPPNSSPSYQQQRAALTLAKGYVWVALGGLWGDCGPYHGWLVGVNAANTSYVSTQIGRSQAGVWAAGGPAADSSGYTYLAVGNGATSSPYDYSDSILKFNGTSRVSYFAPSGWLSDNQNDLDLGAQGPVLIPNGYVFADGKNGNGYLLSQANLGGIGGAKYSHALCSSYGGTAYYNGVVYVPCSDGVRAAQMSWGPPPSFHVIWHISQAASPVVGGGHLWMATNGTMYEVNPATGAVQASWSIGTVTRFTTPTIYGRLLLVGTTSALKAYNIS